jgi:hypothetical protein
MQAPSPHNRDIATIGRKGGIRMPRECSVCTHPARMTIDDRLEAGHSLRDIAGHYTLTKSGLHRHKASHMPLADDVTDLEARL